jgi:UDP-glucose 4-epimerase
MYCTSYAELYGLEPTILRFGIPYGPRARPATVIAAFVGKALAGEPLTLAGDGDAPAPTCRTSPMASSGLEPRAAGRVYNLAGTETVTIKQVAETVQRQVGETGIIHASGRNGDFAGAEIPTTGPAASSAGGAHRPRARVADTRMAAREPGFPAAPRAEEPAREGIEPRDRPFCALLGP